MLSSLKGGRKMSEEKSPVFNEYHEMLEFIRELHESALQQSDKFLSEKKELEYKIKQQEFIIKEKEKKRIPNISMFSPLVIEDTYESDVSCKDELEQLNQKLVVAEETWEHQKKICLSFEKLKTFFSAREFLIMTTNNHNKVHEMHKLFSQAEAAIIAKDFVLYTQTRLALYDAVNALTEFNKISFIEIF